MHLLIAFVAAVWAAGVIYRLIPIPAGVDRAALARVMARGEEHERLPFWRALLLPFNQLAARLPPTLVGDTAKQLYWAQFQGEFGRTRFYVGAGAGYAFNDYETGYGHSQAAMSDLGISSYGVEVDNALLFQYGGGLEFYSTLDAKLNLGVDARFVSGEVDTTEQLGSTGSRESTRDVKLWLIRVGLTWHF